MEWAVDRGIITGTGSGGNYLGSKESATRAQAATMLYKLIHAYGMQ